MNTKYLKEILTIAAVEFHLMTFFLTQFKCL